VSHFYISNDDVCKLQIEEES